MTHLTIAHLVALPQGTALYWTEEAQQAFPGDANKEDEPLLLQGIGTPGLTSLNGVGYEATLRTKDGKVLSVLMDNKGYSKGHTPLLCLVDSSLAGAGEAPAATIREHRQADPRYCTCAAPDRVRNTAGGTWFEVCRACKKEIAP